MRTTIIFLAAMMFFSIAKSQDSQIIIKLSDLVYKEKGVIYFSSDSVNIPDSETEFIDLEIDTNLKVDNNNYKFDRIIFYPGSKEEFTIGFAEDSKIDYTLSSPRDSVGENLYRLHVDTISMYKPAEVLNNLEFTSGEDLNFNVIFEKAEEREEIASECDCRKNPYAQYIQKSEGEDKSGVSSYIENAENCEDCNPYKSPCIVNNKSIQYEMRFTKGIPSPQIFKWKGVCGDSEKVVQKKFYRPRVGRHVLYSFLGYSEEDAVDINHTFQQRNLEYQSQFVSAMSSFFKDSSSANTKEKSLQSGKLKENEKVNLECAIFCLVKNHGNSEDFESYVIGFRDSLVKNEKNIGFEDIQERVRAGINEVWKGSKKDEISNYKTQLKKIMEYLKKESNGKEGVWRKFRVFQVDNKDAIELEVKVGDDIIYSKPNTHLTKGGFKMDFSAGLMYTNLFDHTFTTVKYDTANGGNFPTDLTDTTLVDVIVKEDEGRFNLGGAILMHFYSRTGTRFNISATTGFMLDTDFDPRFLAGGSIILGYEGRFIISGGAVFGKAERIADGFSAVDYGDNSSTPQQIDLSALNNSEIPTVDRWNIGFFVGISYNFASVSLGNGNNKNKSND